MSDIQSINISGTSYTIADATARTTLATKESTANKTTVLSSSSTDTEYPSAKVTYDSIKDSTLGASVSNKKLIIINGGSSEPSGLEKVQFVSDGSVYSTSYIPSGDSVTAPHTNPTKSGKVFKGWVASEGSTTVLTFPYTVNADTTLYAYFSDPVQTGYTVEWSGNKDPRPSFVTFLNSVSATSSDTAIGSASGSLSDGNSFSNKGLYAATNWCFSTASTYPVSYAYTFNYTSNSVTGYSEAVSAFGSENVTPIYG